MNVIPVKILLTCLILGLPLTLMGDELKLKTQFKNPRDSLLIDSKKDQVNLVITCPSGIGQVKVSPSQGGWPSEVTFQWQYSPEKPYRSLEGITLTTDSLQVRSFHKDSGKMKVYLSDTNGEYPSNAPPSGTVDIRILQNQQIFNMLLPKGLLKGDQQVTLHWVDFYR